jgi:adenylate cyclase
MRYRFIFRSSWLRAVVLGVGCALIAWLASFSAVLRGMEDWMLDACFNWRGNRSSQARVIIVALDDESLDEFQKPFLYLSPELAAVVTYLKDQGASAIGIDVFVPDKLSDLPKVAGEGEGDARTLGEAIVKAGNVVLPEWKTSSGWDRGLAQWRFKWESPLREPTDFGFVNLTEEKDQFVRRQQILVRDRAVAHPHFALSLHARAHDAEFEYDPEHNRLRVGDNVIPLDADQLLRINYAGPPNTIPRVPFREVRQMAAERKEARQFRGAIVIIGATATTMQDYHATPFANKYASYLSTSEPLLMSGPEIQANIVATLEDRAFIHEPPAWLTPVLLVIVGIGLAWVFARLNLVWGLGVAVAHHFAWKFLVLEAFAHAAWDLDMVPMLALGALVYLLTFCMRWWLLRQMFGVTQSERIAKALEENPQLLYQSGPDVKFTVLFADIRDFAEYARGRRDEDVVRFLNTYFGAVVPLLEREGGTLNKYLGDGLMVLFGAPLVQPDHAVRAVRAAVAMVRKVHEMKSVWAAMGKENLRIGVGIESGPAIIGFIGSPQRLEYTAIGDTVNAASRIESENKFLGTEILISENTYQLLPEAERTRLGCDAEMKQVFPKGLGAAGIPVHEVRVG